MDALTLDDLLPPQDAPHRDLFAAGGDPRQDALQRLKARVTQFASGLSRMRDFGPAAWAGHPVGVEIGEMSSAALAELARVIIDYRTETFVDSGAFGVFMRGLRGGPCTPLDFDQVLSRYDHLLDLIDDYNAAEDDHPPPLLVMPDIVGDQLASLDLIVKHRVWVRGACWGTGVSRPIIPIQRGPLAPSEVYARLVGVLGTDEFIVGIPSNAAAFSPREFTEFLRQARPRAVHILGAFAPSRLTPRLTQILDSGLSESLEVSADANPLRSIIIERGQGAQTRRDRLVERLGKGARRRALLDFVNELGGPSGLHAHLAGACDDRRRRVIALISDLSGLSRPEVVDRLSGSTSAFTLSYGTCSISDKEHVPYHRPAFARLN